MAEKKKVEIGIGIPFELTEEEKAAILDELEKTNIRKMFQGEGGLGPPETPRICQWQLLPEKDSK